MNSSTNKVEALYPEFLSTTLEGIRTESKRFEEYRTNLLAACTMAWKRSSDYRDTFSSLDLSASEQSMLFEVEGLDSEATRSIWAPRLCSFLSKSS